ncbi:hypothetical protein UF37_15345, partial [Vibrio parahaemolyticus]
LGYLNQPSSWLSKAHLANNTIQFSIEEGQGQVQFVTPSVDANTTLRPQPQSLPLMLSTPTGYSGWTYTQKHNALTVTGNLFILGEEQDLSPVAAGYDFSAGFMRRETSRRWASFHNKDGGQSLCTNP